MALKTDYTLNDVIHKNCYLRIHKIRTAMIDYEYFDKVDDPNRPLIAEELKWKIRNENTATVYIWDDNICRENRTVPLKHFSFEFDYDLDNPRNI